MTGPMLIDADELAGRMNPCHLVDALRVGHRAGPSPEVGRMFLAEAGTPNGFLVWGGWRRAEGLAVKAASIFPGNEAGMAGPNLQSVVLLFDGEDGRPVAVIHGEAFTRMKTAADSGLAADLLARPDASTLVVLGSGAQAETHVRFLRAVRPGIRKVVVHARSLVKARDLAARIARTGVETVATGSVEDAVRAADILTCLTAACDPLFDGGWLAEGAHVDLVGGFTPDMRESDDVTVVRGRLFADTRRFTVETCGDFSQPIARGVISAEKIEADLFELCSGARAGRRSAVDITVFKNGGGGHLDLMAAAALHEFQLRTMNSEERGP